MLKYLQNHTYAQNLKKISALNITNFRIFWEVIEYWKEFKNVQPLFRYQKNEAEKTRFAKFYYLSVSQNQLSK